MAFDKQLLKLMISRCAVCGLKINSPKRNIWEVEAAHIVPHSSDGKDDLLNGLSLCRLHHWAFDVGWFSLFDDYTIAVSPEADNLRGDFGKIGNYYFLKELTQSFQKISLPSHENIYPHYNSIKWHRETFLIKNKLWKNEIERLISSL